MPELRNPMILACLDVSAQSSRPNGCTRHCIEIQRIRLTLTVANFDPVANVDFLGMRLQARYKLLSSLQRPLIFALLGLGILAIRLPVLDRKSVV